jgi:branched-chain amino acid transport system permease protein
MKRILWKPTMSEIGYLIAFLGLMGIVPVFAPSALLYILGLTFIFIILSVSWDIMVGYTGEVNLGHTVFIGIGGYITALLNVPTRLVDTPFSFIMSLPKLPIFITIILGGIGAALFGLLIGAVTLRLKGWYFALVTAILPLIFIKTTLVFSSVFGGEEGFSIGLENLIARTTVGKYYISLIALVVCLLIMYGIANSKIGLTFKAIREESELAESLGIDIFKYKVIAISISSFFGGIGGALMVHYRGTISPDLYDIPLMLLIILAVVIGGLGTVIGPILGGFLIYILKYWILKGYFMTLIPYWLPINDDIILYSLLIVIALIAPHGLWNKIKKLYVSI